MLTRLTRQPARGRPRQHKAMQGSAGDADDERHYHARQRRLSAEAGHCARPDDSGQAAQRRELAEDQHEPPQQPVDQSIGRRQQRIDGRARQRP